VGGPLWWQCHDATPKCNSAQLVATVAHSTHVAYSLARPSATLDKCPHRGRRPHRIHYASTFVWTFPHCDARQSGVVFLSCATPPPQTYPPSALSRRVRVRSRPKPAPLVDSPYFSSTATPTPNRLHLPNPALTAAQAANRQQRLPFPRMGTGHARNIRSRRRTVISSCK